MSRRADRWVWMMFGCILATSLVGGCRSGSGSDLINPGTSTVTISVWRMLAPGDVPENRSNVGCRLFAAEINAIVRNLIDNAPMFGGNTSFTWNGQIRDLVNDRHDDPFYYVNNDTTNNRTYITRLIDDYAFEQFIAVNNAWREFSINIYFVVDIQGFGAPELPAVDRWGAARDPRDHRITLGGRDAALDLH